MKTFLLAATLFAAAIPAVAADVGVSISVGQPGFYGRINIGDFPQPAVIYSQPIIVQQATTYVREPIYLRVPPGHAKKWSKHCGKYNACNQPVYFVQDNWYSNVYVPQYQSKHRAHKAPHASSGHHDKHEKHQGKGHGKNNGNSNGKGHGKGHNKD